MDLLGFSLTTLRISAFVTSVLLIARPPNNQLVVVRLHFVDKVEPFQLASVGSDGLVDSEFQSDGLGVLGTLTDAIQDLKFDFRTIPFVVHSVRPPDGWVSLGSLCNLGYVSLCAEF